ncbi:MAG TPA: 3-deoxy-manno-octulosonate cytidylyltransferase [Cytophagaceae bacterium]|jgi:3-deoxy-manno-octulosonate cytidylyltransferase (CMP-KDO synthetase)|nr:3-deoxy-manno-octulosonate cytidylyltransferase [Cytophagaceae bacterium]
MKILGIIPTRFASTRFPEKALVDIGGKSMVQRVYEQALKSATLSKVVIATDHKKIFDHVTQFGGHVVMTSETHQSGTDRCAEALVKENDIFDFVINIQGDEPFIKPEQIDLLTSILTEETELATLAKKITDEETLFNPNTPKMIWNEKMEAIYFSRQTIPYVRSVNAKEWLSKHDFYKHIGIYAYRVDVLKKITKLPLSVLERAECLEQLRWLENGYKIKVAITEFETIGIDTPDDLTKIAHLL